ncbi:MAG TPA: MOSC domain-containing protein [Bacteroidota bacterium]|jgi:MOSC domain-containing protein YiiM|nr:MOSC domain-containing protein [Bacteroidota bacterium]
MKLISVNVSLPKEVQWEEGTVSTAIFKEPVRHRVKVYRRNLEGDKQADQTVHGGPDKAIYAYASEHYDRWKKDLRRADLPWGMFGENLTISGGLFESEIFIGDRFAIGTAELMAIQPRMPCYKLGIRFGTQRIVKQFAQSRRYGVYFRVIKEGELGAGDPVKLLGRNLQTVSIQDVGRLLLEHNKDLSLIERAIGIDVLPEYFRNYFSSLLE